MTDRERLAIRGPEPYHNVPSGFGPKIIICSLRSPSRAHLRTLLLGFGIDLIGLAFWPQRACVASRCVPLQKANRPLCTKDGGTLRTVLIIGTAIIAQAWKHRSTSYKHIERRVHGDP
jgi:hypothetical protein